MRNNSLETRAVTGLLRENEYLVNAPFFVGTAAPGPSAEHRSAL